MNFLSLFTERELMIMGLVLGSLVLIILILFISEKFSKESDCEEKLELEDENIQILENEELQPKVEEKKLVEESQVELVEEIQNVEIKPVKEEIEELIIDDEPIIKKIESPEILNIEPTEKAKMELLKAEEEIINQPSLEDTLTNLETIEEENAIISYQELVENTTSMSVVEDDGDEPITLDEVFKLFNDNSDNGIVINEALEAIPIEDAYQGEFNSTPYLSPINGVENESLAEIQLENTANLEKLDKEIRKTNQFLNILNELKKNLE